MLKSSLKYSILCGLFLLVLFWVSLLLGSSPLLEIRHFFFDLLIFFFFVYFAAREYKQYQNDGFLHFWQGMSIAFLVYLPAAVIFAIGLLLILYVDDSIIESYKEGAPAFLESKREVFLERLTQSEYDERLRDIDNVTFSDLVVSSGLKKLVAGFFITPVVSILLRKKPN